MCYNCGCHMIHDNMGHPDNITEETLEKLAQKWGKPLAQTKTILYQKLSEGKVDEDPDLKEVFSKASQAWGQPPDQAKKNTMELLK